MEMQLANVTWQTGLLVEQLHEVSVEQNAPWVTFKK